MSITDHYRGGLTEKQAVTIVTSDPTTNRIEAIGKDAAVLQIASSGIAPAFRWPQVGERWMIIRENGLWILNQRIPGPDDQTHTLGVGDVLLDGINAVLADGTTLAHNADLQSLQAQVTALQAQVTALLTPAGNSPFVQQMGNNKIISQFGQSSTPAPSPAAAESPPIDVPHTLGVIPTYVYTQTVGGSYGNTLECRWDKTASTNTTFRIRAESNATFAFTVGFVWWAIAAS